MQEQVNEPAPNRNHGWFRPGDRRINREGRPKGSSKSSRQPSSPAVDRAPCADRLQVLVVPTRDLARRLRWKLAPWITNLPEDAEIVSCRVDAARDTVAFVLRSNTFPRIAAGAVIPVFVPRFEGLRWQRG